MDEQFSLADSLTAYAQEAVDELKTTTGEDRREELVAELKDYLWQLEEIATNLEGQV